MIKKISILVIYFSSILFISNAFGASILYDLSDEKSDTIRKNGRLSFGLIAGTNYSFPSGKFYSSYWNFSTKFDVKSEFGMNFGLTSNFKYNKRSVMGISFVYIYDRNIIQFPNKEELYENNYVDFTFLFGNYFFEHIKLDYGFGMGFSQKKGKRKQFNPLIGLTYDLNRNFYLSLSYKYNFIFGDPYDLSYFSNYDDGSYEGHYYSAVGDIYFYGNCMLQVGYQLYKNKRKRKVKKFQYQ